MKAMNYVCIAHISLMDKNKIKLHAIVLQFEMLFNFDLQSRRNSLHKH